MPLSIIVKSRHFQRKFDYHSSLIKGILKSLNTSFLQVEKITVSNFLKKGFEVTQVKNAYMISSSSQVHVILEPLLRKITFINEHAKQNFPCSLTLSFYYNKIEKETFFSLVDAQWKNGTHIYGYPQGGVSLAKNKLIYIEDDADKKTYAYKRELIAIPALGLNDTRKLHPEFKFNQNLKKNICAVYNFSFKNFIEKIPLHFSHNKPLFYMINDGKIQSLHWTHTHIQEQRIPISKPSVYFLNKYEKVSQRKFIIRGVNETEKFETFFKEIGANLNGNLSPEEQALFEMNNSNML